MMKAMVLTQFGGPEMLSMAEIERPRAQPGNVVVQVAYAAINPADWKAREGWLSRYFDYQFPFVLGFDAAGIIAEVGADVEGLQPGDRVVTPGNQGLGERGSYAQFLHAAAERTIRLPDSISLSDAATLPTAGMTAWEATLDVGNADAGKSVVVNGGAGGTGSFAIQLARMAGARVAATCSPSNFDYVRSLGADPIDYREGKALELIRAWVPEGVDLIVDTVGQGSFVDALFVMKCGGIIAPIGTFIADEPTIDAAKALAAGVRIVPVISTFPNQPRQLTDLVNALASGAIRAPDYQCLPLEHAGEAHRRIQEGHVRGKILLAVDERLDA